MKWTAEDSVAQDSRFSRLLYSRSRSRQDQKCQDQDKTRLVQKFQEILSRALAQPGGGLGVR